MLEQNGDGPLNKYSCVLDEKVNLRPQTEVSAETTKLLLRMN